MPPKRPPSPPQPPDEQELAAQGFDLLAKTLEEERERMRVKPTGLTPRYPLPGVSEHLTEMCKEMTIVAQSDWGPIFVYGTMTVASVWGALIGRVPDMRCAMVRGYDRRGVMGTGFAAMFEEEGAIVVGQAVLGLRPWERKLVDAVVDDSFLLQQVTASYLDEPDGEEFECCAYVFKEMFYDGLTEEDWDLEIFHEHYLPDLENFCKDEYEIYRCSVLDDKALKNLALARRRREAVNDDDGEGSYHSQDEEDD
eukprot:TRINITY_DN106299_c0_g1_i1.p1 TRINITY_DN106299_c0_g1~~TRINITY_DN106299_c0_g1_i1.p1  ORF type:complete len:253 (+),score=64.16 TRINITY_DN106299_c0_g1_i1:189-947(+)